MTITSILIFLVIGGIAGWLAGFLFKGSGFGLLINILLGVVGSVVGSWLLGLMGVSMPGGAIISSILTALIGASALLLVAMVLRRIFPKERKRT